MFTSVWSCKLLSISRVCKSVWHTSFKEKGVGLVGLSVLLVGCLFEYYVSVVVNCYIQVYVFLYRKILLQKIIEKQNIKNTKTIYRNYSTPPPPPPP